MRRTLLLLAALVGPAATPAVAQPPRAPEVFGTFGVMRGGGDEGSAGSGVTYGGAATLPFASRWAADVQVLTSHLSDHPDFRLRRLLVSPAVQYRRGSERGYWFIAFGPGYQGDHTRGTYTVYGPDLKPQREVDFDTRVGGLTLHWRTGGVLRPASRVLIRTEFFWANRYVLPNAGFAVSLGVRLGR